MKAFKINRWKGLLENVSFANKPPDYAEGMINLDEDNPYGQLTIRDGSLKKYSDTFTSILAAYEYKFPTSGEVILLINDDGTLELYKDGVKQTNLTLPTGSTLEASFKNQMMGYKDSILITAGNGSTNHMLWYGYTKRTSAENNGLFNNTVVDSGTYRLLRAQMIPDYGVFNNIHNAVSFGASYYISFGSLQYYPSGYSNMPSKYIEKRDTLMRLVATYEIDSAAADNHLVSMCADSTHIFASSEDDIYKITPANWYKVASVSLGSSDIYAMGQDTTHLYVVTGDHLYRRLKSDLTAVDDTAVAIGTTLGLAIPATGSYFYTSYKDGSNNNIVQQRLKSDLSVNASLTLFASASYSITYLAYDNGNLYVATNHDKYDFNLTSPSAAYMYIVNTSTMALSSTRTTQIENFIWIGMATPFTDPVLCAIKRAGIINITTEAMLYPEFVNIHTRAISVGAGFGLTRHTFFYKCSIVDTDGQEYTLSDPAKVTQVGDNYANTVIISLNKAKITSGDMYRVKSINVYRASSTKVDDYLPETDYRLLESIDINDFKWKDSDTWDDTDTDVWQYSIWDTVTEANMSSLTYLQNSGISDETKPRYVNPKYMTFLDDQLHVANFYCDDQTYKNQIIRSPVNQPANIAFYDFYTYGSEGFQIKGITNAFGRTVVFKEQDFGVFYGGRLEYSDTPGVFSERGYVKHGDDIYFCNNDGIFLLRGHEKVQFGDPVEVSWAGISDYTTCTMFIFDDKERLIITYPQGQSFIYNMKYKTWKKYDTGFGFKGYMKNISNEYIAWGKPLGQASEYIWKIASGLDCREANGSGGTAKSITYNSGLIKFTGIPSMWTNMYSIQYRTKSTSGITLTVYRYKDDTRTSVYSALMTVSISPTYETTKIVYPSGAYGESFSWHLSGSVATFNMAEIAFLFGEIGIVS